MLHFKLKCVIFSKAVLLIYKFFFIIAFYGNANGLWCSRQGKGGFCICALIDFWLLKPKALTGKKRWTAMN